MFVPRRPDANPDKPSLFRHCRGEAGSFFVEALAGMNGKLVGRSAMVLYVAPDHLSL